MQRTVLVFIGPQGSGKGTQAKILADREGFHVIEMGGLLRAEAAKNTPMSEQVRAILAKGDLVPARLTIELIRKKLATLPTDANIVFDGFPRSLEQAQELDTLVRITRVVHIDVPPDVSVKRISGRLMCPAGHNYNTYYVPPEKEGICNVDKLPLVHREDDTPTAVRHRLELYNEVTTKVLEYYRGQGKLLTVNGDASVFAVSQQINQEVQVLV
ncbi:MAG: nucleoside monophosphate kinase [Candidatus Komeilibacteria bacterium]|nr:nucleoside monophosphate kinase [Candidatus Komeilibacteria bacterium]